MLPAAGVSRRPANLTPEQAASAGVPFSTAWSCLVDAAHLQSGETVVVSGAAGAVGWAAVELAAALGAKPIGLVKDADEAGGSTGAGSPALPARRRGPPVVREVTGGGGRTWR